MKFAPVERADLTACSEAGQRAFLFAVQDAYSGPSWRALRPLADFRPASGLANIQFTAPEKDMGGLLRPGLQS